MFLFAAGLIADIQKKITEAFEVFDRESNKTVDVRFVNIFTKLLQNLNKQHPKLASALPENVIEIVLLALFRQVCL